MVETRTPRHKQRVTDSPLTTIVKAELKRRRAARLAGIRTIGDVAADMGTTLPTLNSYLDGRRKMLPSGQVTAASLAQVMGLEVEAVERAAAETQAIVEALKGSSGGPPKIDE